MSNHFSHPHLRGTNKETPRVAGVTKTANKTRGEALHVVIHLTAVAPRNAPVTSTPTRNRITQRQFASKHSGYCYSNKPSEVGTGRFDRSIDRPRGRSIARPSRAQNSLARETFSFRRKINAIYKRLSHPGLRFGFIFQPLWNFCPDGFTVNTFAVIKFAWRGKFADGLIGDKSVLYWREIYN